MPSKSRKSGLKSIPKPVVPLTRTIKLTIEYDGTRFRGWQIQYTKSRTVQGELEKACRAVFRTVTRPVGSGRTDSGVHALGQVAHIRTNSLMPTATMVKALNAHLPEDIVILDAKNAPKNFHAQFNAKNKTYRYTILNRETRCAQLRNACYRYPHTLNLRLMRQEARALVGTKDFASFQAADPAAKRTQKKKSTVRTIKNITIARRKGFITIDITANGFLYKMARTIVGTLLLVASKRLAPGSIKGILAKKDRKAAGNTAPAKGLCLMEVKY